MPCPTCVHGDPDNSEGLRSMVSRTVNFTDAHKAVKALLKGPQRYTCLAGGARSGKTFLIVHTLLERASKAPDSRHMIFRFHANAARAAIDRDTMPTVRDLCFKGVGLKHYKTDGFWGMSNDSRLMVGGLDDPERIDKILGLEFASVFLNEASQIPYESALVAFTRLAQVVPEIEQRAYVDLNPTAKTHWTNVLFGDKREPISMQPLSKPQDYVRAFLNPRDNAENLAPAFIESLAALPERQRKRFYEGVYVEAVDDALWSYEIIDQHRRPPEAIAAWGRKSVVVAIDPSGGGEDETGIIVAARGQDGDGYILADRSCREPAIVWARRAVHAFDEFSADCIVAESNFGGDMVLANIKVAGPAVPVRLVTATRGKAVRAEPVSMRYALGQVHHVGRFAKLEDQLCAFTSGGYGGRDSPDRADAAIWALTHLFGGHDDPVAMIEHYRRLVEG